MAIRVDCPCGKVYEVPDEHAGRRFRCQNCGEVLVIGSPAAPDELPPAVPTEQEAALPAAGQDRSADEFVGDLLAWGAAPGPAQSADAAPAGLPELGLPDDLPPPERLAAAEPAHRRPDLPLAKRSPAKCPGCGAELAAGAVLCTACGYDLRTGSRPAEAAEKPPVPTAPKASRPKREISLPIAKIVVLVLIVGGLASGWLFVIRPARAGSSLEKAFAPAVDAKTGDALANLRRITPSLPGRYRAQGELMIAQLELEQQYAGRPPATQKTTFEMEALPELKEAGENQKILYHVTAKNTGSDAVTLRNECFFLRNSAGVIPATTHTSDPLDGRTVGPGETVKGIVAFWKLPGATVGLITTVFESAVLVYNDGRQYVVVPLEVPEEGQEGAGALGALPGL